MLILYLLISFFVTISMRTNCAPLLDELGLKYRTDKSSSHHNYLNIYQKYLEIYRNQPIRFLEIGFYRGDSARMWQEYFSNALLFFIDIDPKVFDSTQSLGSRFDLALVDQSNKQALQDYIKKTGGNFDVIIDDGGHTMKQQIISFETLFPHLRSGGLYIIEDLHTCYNLHPYTQSNWRILNDMNGLKTTDYLKQRIDDLNYIGAKTLCADHLKFSQELKKTLNIYQASITALHFYDS